MSSSYSNSITMARKNYCTTESHKLISHGEVILAMTNVRSTYWIPTLRKLSLLFENFNFVKDKMHYLTQRARPFNY